MSPPTSSSLWTHCHGSCFQLVLLLDSLSSLSRWSFTWTTFSIDGDQYTAVDYPWPSLLTAATISSSRHSFLHYDPRLLRHDILSYLPPRVSVLQLLLHDWSKLKDQWWATMVNFNVFAHMVFLTLTIS